MCGPTSITARKLALIVITMEAKPETLLHRLWCYNVFYLYVGELIHWVLLIYGVLLITANVFVCHSWKKKHKCISYDITIIIFCSHVNNWLNMLVCLCFSLWFKGFLCSGEHLLSLSFPRCILSVFVFDNIYFGTHSGIFLYSFLLLQKKLKTNVKTPISVRFQYVFIHISNNRSRRAAS